MHLLRFHRFRWLKCRPLETLEPRRGLDQVRSMVGSKKKHPLRQSQSHSTASSKPRNPNSEPMFDGLWPTTCKNQSSMGEAVWSKLINSVLWAPQPSAGSTLSKQHGPTKSLRYTVRERAITLGSQVPPAFSAGSVSRLAVSLCVFIACCTTWRSVILDGPGKLRQPGPIDSNT